MIRSLRVVLFSYVFLPSFILTHLTPAYALRPAGLEENKKRKRELASALQGRPFPAVAIPAASGLSRPLRSSAAASPPVSTGLEEVERVLVFGTEKAKVQGIADTLASVRSGLKVLTAVVPRQTAKVETLLALADHPPAAVVAGNASLLSSSPSMNQMVKRLEERGWLIGFLGNPSQDLAQELLTDLDDRLSAGLEETRLIHIQRETPVLEADTIVQHRGAKSWVVADYRDGSVQVQSISPEGLPIGAVRHLERDKLVQFYKLVPPDFIGNPGGIGFHEVAEAVGEALKDPSLLWVYFPNTHKGHIAKHLLTDPAKTHRNLVEMSPVGAGEKKYTLFKSGPTLVVRLAAASAGLEEWFESELRELKRRSPELFDILVENTRRDAEGLDLVVPNARLPRGLAAIPSLPPLVQGWIEGTVLENYYQYIGKGDDPFKKLQRRAEQQWLEVVSRYLYPGVRQEYTVDLRPHSAATALYASFRSTLKPGDTFMTMSLIDGGVVTGGHDNSLPARDYRRILLQVNPKTREIDYVRTKLDAVQHPEGRAPRLLMIGPVAHTRPINFAALRKMANEISEETGVPLLLVADVSLHFPEILAGDYPNPFPYMDAVILSTRLFGGTGGAVLFVRNKYYADVNANLGVHEKKTLAEMVAREIGALQPGWRASDMAVKEALAEWMLGPEFGPYAAQITRNAKALSSTLRQLGVKLVGPDIGLSQMLLDSRFSGVPGKRFAEALASVGIFTNPNPFAIDPAEEPQLDVWLRKTKWTNAVRLGVANLTGRGMKEAQMQEIAQLIALTLKHTTSEAGIDAFIQIERRVKALAGQFPVNKKLLEQLVRIQQEAGAASAVPLVKPRLSLAALIVQLQDPVTREQAAKELLRRDSTELLMVIPELMRRSLEGDSKADQILRRSHPLAARAAEDLAIFRDSNQAVPRRAQALADLGQLFAADGTPVTSFALSPIVDGLSKALEEQDPQIRLAAVQSAAKFGRRAHELVPKLQALARLPEINEEVRSAAGAALALIVPGKQGFTGGSKDSPVRLVLDNDWPTVGLEELLQALSGLNQIPRFFHYDPLDENLRPRAVLVDASDDVRVAQVAKALSIMMARDRIPELNFRVVIHQHYADKLVRELAAVNREAAESFLRPRIVIYNYPQSIAVQDFAHQSAIRIAKAEALSGLASDEGFESVAQMQQAGVLHEVNRLTPQLALELRAFFTAGGLNFVTDEAFDCLQALFEAA